jgi:hypothetical protein
VVVVSRALFQVVEWGPRQYRMAVSGSCVSGQGLLVSVSTPYRAPPHAVPGGWNVPVLPAPPRGPCRAPALGRCGSPLSLPMGLPTPCSPVRLDVAARECMWIAMERAALRRTAPPPPSSGPVHRNSSKPGNIVWESRRALLCHPAAQHRACGGAADAVFSWQGPWRRAPHFFAKRIEKTTPGRIGKSRALFQVVEWGPRQYRMAVSGSCVSGQGLLVSVSTPYRTPPHAVPGKRNGRVLPAPLEVHAAPPPWADADRLFLTLFMGLPAPCSPVRLAPRPRNARPWGRTARARAAPEAGILYSLLVHPGSIYDYCLAQARSFERRHGQDRGEAKPQGQRHRC